MKQNKNLWIGLGAVVIIIVIILVITLGGKNKAAVTPIGDTSPVITDSELPVKKSSSKKSMQTTPSGITVISPAVGSTLKRGSTIAVAWTGPAECYDLGYSFNMSSGDNDIFNPLNKVCKNNEGVFRYSWATPLNIAKGSYSLKVRTSGSSQKTATTLTTFNF